MTMVSKSGGTWKLEKALYKTEKEEYSIPSDLQKTLKSIRKTISYAPLRCYDCGTTRTPHWRRGRKGPGVLCNACGLKFKTSSERIEKNRRRRKLYTLNRLMKANNEL
jgi:hypothetical protein